MRFSVDAVKTIWRSVDESVWTRGRAQCCGIVNDGSEVRCSEGNLLSHPC